LNWGTYPKNSRVIRNPGRLGLCIFLGLFLGDADIAHIATTEDDVFVNSRGRGDLLRWVLAATLRAKRLNIFQSYRGGFGVDFVKCADIAGRCISSKFLGLRKDGETIPNLALGNEVEALTANC
jgi:hypothetical protein